MTIFFFKFHCIGSTAASMGFKFNVSLLSSIDDVCVSGCLSMGRGKHSEFSKCFVCRVEVSELWVE